MKVYSGFDDTDNHDSPYGTGKLVIHSLVSLGSDQAKLLILRIYESNRSSLQSLGACRRTPF